jgi:aminoglycoside phosphotransferase (APT) family kinase protein
LDAHTIQLALDQLAPRLVTGGIAVQGLARLSGGASQETWRFEVLDSGKASTPLILRRSPHEGPRNSEALGLVTEARVMNAARTAAMLVPSVVHQCSPEDGVGEAFIMEFIEGETLARKILRDDDFSNARDVLASQCGAAMAGIHAIAINDTLPELPTSHGLDQLTRYEAIYRGFEVNRPVIELAIKWLRDRAPAPTQTSLVHGDFRNGNIIVGPDGLRAVLDWELVHLGDPREDLGWICVNSWRFGHAHKAVGGFGDLTELVDAYVKAGGTPFAMADIKWFQALGSFKWAIMCLIMYNAFQTGADPSIERAMIGRRTSEAEIDLLNLMEGRAHA